MHHIEKARRTCLSSHSSSQSALDGATNANRIRYRSQAALCISAHCTASYLADFGKAIELTAVVRYFINQLGMTRDMSKHLLAGSGARSP